MPLLHFFDRAGLLAAPTLTLDPELSTLLAARVRHIEAEGLLDLTELLVIDATANEADLVDAIGWWPLRDADGHLYGEPAFAPPFDHVYRASARYHVGVQTVGNSGFAFEIIVAEDAEAELLAMLRELAA